MTVVSLVHSDATLIAQVKAGNQRGFRDLVNRYVSLVYAYIYRMTQNAELSDEMTQDVFVKVHKYLHTFDETRPFKPWLLRIAANTTMSALRKQKKTVSLDALQEETPGKEWGADTQPGNDPSHLAEVRDLSQQVLAGMQTLAPNYRQVLLLRYSEALSYEEIAQTLEVPVNTIRTWIKRGREKLKAHVKEYLP